MRKEMQRCVRSVIAEHSDAALIMIDIGGMAFSDLCRKYPDRVKNIGIFEPGTVSLAAGLSLNGITPFVYGISPFIVQRSLEQLKLDFIYQQTGGNFITTGASYDFSTLGYSHYCAEDAATLKTLPGFEVLCPGTPDQFRALFDACWDDGRPTYYRMTDFCNNTQAEVEFGKAAILRRGQEGTVVVMAEMLDAAMEAFRDKNVTILYYTTAAPFDRETLRQCFTGHDLYLCHPFYEGTFAYDIQQALGDKQFTLHEAAVPLQVLRNYGTKKEKDEYLHLTARTLFNSTIKGGL